MSAQPSSRAPAADHRRHARSDADFPVHIHFRNVGTIRGTARNLGVGGIFVETRGVAPPTRSLVTLRFAPRPSDPVRVMDALVVHCADGGVGLMFESSPGIPDAR